MNYDLLLSISLIIGEKVKDVRLLVLYSEIFVTINEQAVELVEVVRLREVRVRCELQLPYTFYEVFVVFLRGCRLIALDPDFIATRLLYLPR